MRSAKLLISMLCLALASCVAQKQFTVNTSPQGAAVTINGKSISGVTPVTTEIREDKDLGIVVERPGYEVGSLTVNTKTSWWRSLLWTENDPRARYIEEDSVTIPLKPLRNNATYTPSTLDSFQLPTSDSSSSSYKPLNNSTAPALRDMPSS